MSAVTTSSPCRFGYDHTVPAVPVLISIMAPPGKEPCAASGHRRHRWCPTGCNEDPHTDSSSSSSSPHPADLWTATTPQAAPIVADKVSPEPHSGTSSSRATRSRSRSVPRSGRSDDEGTGDPWRYLWVGSPRLPNSDQAPTILSRNAVDLFFGFEYQRSPRAEKRSRSNPCDTESSNRNDQLTGSRDSGSGIAYIELLIYASPPFPNNPQPIVLHEHINGGRSGPVR